MLSVKPSTGLMKRRSRQSLLIALLSPGAAPVTEATAFGVAIALTILSAEFTFRYRDPSLALSGNADSQVLVALGISAIIGVWLVLRRIMIQLTDKRSLLVHRKLQRRSPLKVIRFLAMFALVSSLWSPTSIAPVRAIQFIIVVELMADAAMTCRANVPAISALHKALRRTVFIGVAAAAVLTFTDPAFSPYFPTYNGPSRLRLLAMHPLATANLLAVVALLIFSPVWSRGGADGGGKRARLTHVLRLLGGGTVVAVMIMTRERGSSTAGLLALAVLVLLNTDRRKFQLALIGIASVVIALFPLVGSGLASFTARGETTGGITSLSGRNEIFSEAVRLFWLRPYLGWGYNAGRSIFLPTIPWAGESHNVIVEIAISGGLLGLISYSVLFYLWFQMVRNGLRVPGTARRLSSVSIALTVLVVVVGIGSDSFAGPPKLLVISLGLAFMQAELASGLTQDLSDVRSRTRLKARRPDDQPNQSGTASYHGLAGRSV